jgi:hypothetical protein
MKTLTKLFIKHAYVVAYAELWLFIGFISAIDIYVSIKTRAYLLYCEMNPLGRWLIRLDGGDIALFMGIKTAGTVLALGLLVWLYHLKQSWAWPVIIALSLAQLFVLWTLR